MVFGSPILYHSATHMIGSQLSHKEKGIFHDLVKEIRRLFVEAESSRKIILQICSKFILTETVLGMDESIPTLKAVVKYLRHVLIEMKVAMIYLRIVRLLDALIRKCGIRAHALIGQKRFLQTLSLTARRWTLPIRTSLDPHAQEAADYVFDCILSWTEGLSSKWNLFPHYYSTYQKLKHKYHVKFIKAEHDPSRLPIDLNGNSDPNELDEQELHLSESIDDSDLYHPSGKMTRDAHVSYAVYNEFGNGSFRGSPLKDKAGMADDSSSATGTITSASAASTASETNLEIIKSHHNNQCNNNTFEFKNPARESIRKSVSIRESKSYVPTFMKASEFEEDPSDEVNYSVYEEEKERELPAAVPDRSSSRSFQGFSNSPSNRTSSRSFQDKVNEALNASAAERSSSRSFQVKADESAADLSKERSSSRSFQIVGSENNENKSGNNESTNSMSHTGSFSKQKKSVRIQETALMMDVDYTTRTTHLPPLSPVRNSIQPSAQPQQPQHTPPLLSLENPRHSTVRKGGSNSEISHSSSLQSIESAAASEHSAGNLSAGDPSTGDDDRSTASFSDHIARYNALSESYKSKRTRKTSSINNAANNNAVAEKDGKFEIRFFGSQRVVVAKS